MVEAERTRPEWPQETRVLVGELGYGKILRAFELPNDASREQIEATVKAIRDTGAEVLHAHPVYLRGATREHFMSWLHEHDPALHARYEVVGGYDVRADIALRSLPRVSCTLRATMNSDTSAAAAYSP